MQAIKNRSIALEAYSPLGAGRHLEDRQVSAIAERVGRAPARVLIRWSVQRGLIVLPKSTHRERIVANADVSTLNSPTTWPPWTRRTGDASRALERPRW